MIEVNDMSRWFVYCLDGDPEMPCLGNCLNTTDMGPFLVNLVGEGNPYYAFETLPVEILTADAIAVNFNGAPLCSGDWQTNRIAVADQFANPVAAGVANDTVNKVWVAE